MRDIDFKVTPEEFLSSLGEGVHIVEFYAPN